MELTPEKKKKLTKWIIGIAAACIVLFLGLQNLGAVGDALSWCIGLVQPLVLGAAIALILNVPMRFLESHIGKKAKRPIWQKLRRPLSFVLALLFILAVLGGIVWLVIPELAEAVKVIANGAIGMINTLNGMSEAELAELPLGNALMKVNWKALLDTLQSWLKEKGGTIVNTAFGTVTSLVGGIVDFFIAFVFAVYILFSKDKLKAQARRIARVWLPPKASVRLLRAASVANVNFRNFISGQSLEAVILGALCMIGMLIFGFPYAPMVGALVGVTALVPVVGGFIGAGVGAFMILTVDPLKALLFLVFILILQQLEGNIIYPRVMGSRVNLPSIWILAAVTVGGGIGGPVGMLLAVPLASTAYQLFKEATAKREKKAARK